MAFNRKAHLIANTEAIKIAFELEKTKREATTRERLILKGFSGFGGIKCVLFPIDKPENWMGPDEDLYPHVKDLITTIKDQTDEKRFKEYYESLKNSVLTSFYTPAEITGVIATQLKNAGIVTENFLDPSAGTGQFLDSFLTHNNPYSNSYAYEKDLLTGLVLKGLHPASDVRVESYSEVGARWNNKFDVISSNIPFGDFNVFDAGFVNSKDKIKQLSCRAIHNYFFIKSVDLLQNGGVLAFITTESFMNSSSHENIRQYLIKNCNLLSATRLPSNLFTDYAGTSAGSDLVVLQKFNGKTSLSSEEKKFVKSDELDGISMNSYFQDMKHVVHTKGGISTDQYGKPAFVFEHENGTHGIATDLNGLLDKDLWRFNAPLFQMNQQSRGVADKTVFTFGDLFSQPKAPEPLIFTDYDPLVHYLGCLVMFHDKVCYIKDIDSRENKAIVEIRETSDTQKHAIADFIGLREDYFRLFDYEFLNREENPQLRNNLNLSYDHFVQDHGNLNHKSNRAFIIWDHRGKELLSLERITGEQQFVKADIFSTPVAFQKVDKKDFTPLDALLSTLNVYGHFNMEYVCKVTARTEEEISGALSDKIIYNPLNGTYETREKFISGNVVEKINNISDFLSAHPKDEKAAYVLAQLQEARPEKIAYELLDFNLGERWIPDTIYSDFASDLFNSYVTVNYSSAVDKFGIQCSSRNFNITEKYAVQTESRLYNGLHLLEYALENTTPDITKTITDAEGKEYKVKDDVAIQQATAKIDLIRGEFLTWLSSQDEAFKTALADRYNDMFNCYVVPKYDGTHQTFPGLHLENMNIPELYDSQKSGIWMNLQNEGGINRPRGGHGQTLVMVISSYEMKRLGIASKPMIIGLKANVHEIADTYKKVYPDAKVLYPGKEDFSTENRTRFLHDIKNNNWDCIILSHQQFEAIPQDPDIQKSIITDEIRNIELDLDTLTGGNTSKALLKGLEKRKENLIAELSLLELKINEKRDDVPNFKEMGIDHLFVDESHNFKNLMFTTRHVRVAGLGNSTGSQKATNLLFAIRTIQGEKQKDLCTTFLSGTPISNSLTELYLLFKYLTPRELERQNIVNFDAWAAVFTRKTIDFEFSVTNQIIQKERFRHFIKVPELSVFYNRITDYRTADMIGIDHPGWKKYWLIFHLPPIKRTLQND